MLKAIIIDDEANGIKFLQYLIENNCPDIEIIATETEPQKGIELIKKHKPDVVFLDIEMPGMNGFEVLEQLKLLAFHVIFTTAYDNYAIKAFKYNTVDYLLKPIIVTELVSAVNKLLTKNKNKMEDISISKLLQQLQDTQSPKRLIVNGQSETVYLDPKNILRLESDSNYTYIILLDGKKITSTKTLKEYESTLSADTFFRAHKTVMVNINYIEKYVKTDGGYIVMQDEVKVPVSREKRQDLLTILSSI
ncbi:MAG TPA: LytTR family DNA-binding domain-containing protein [Bacteroidia bacterium]|nr:LytTR family DNA-binding domain-containing protein [Bacteroidia bacterium]